MANERERTMAARVCIVQCAICELVWTFIAFKTPDMSLGLSLACAAVIIYAYVTIWMGIDFHLANRR